MTLYDTVSKITGLISVAENSNSLKSLRARMDSDFDLLVLSPYVATKGYESYTSTAPRNFYDKVIDGLNRAVIPIQIKLPENASEEERRDASKAELLLFGALNQIDRRLASRGEPPLRECLGFQICARGWYALRPLVYAADKETIFDVAIWDPIHVTWAYGPNGLIWAAYKRKATASQIYSEYNIEITGESASVIDWWDEDKNAIIVDDVFTKSPTKHHLGHVPALIGAVGSMPTVQTSDYSGTIEYRGDSVWAASRDIYEPKNKYISQLMDIQKRAVVGSIKHRSKDGTKKLTGDPWANWQEIPLEDGEDVEPLELPKAPPEVAGILGLLDKDEMQSTLPYPQAYGGSTEAMSGRALTILADATRSVYGPRTGSMTRIYTWLCEELLHQYVKKGLKIKDLKGHDTKGKFFSVMVKPTEIKEDWFILAKCEPVMPRDQESEILMAKAASEPRGAEGMPLLDDLTIYEDILKLRDPDAVKDRILVQKGEYLPPILAANIAASLKRSGKDELAEQVMMLLAPPGQRQVSGGGGGGGQPLPIELIKAVIHVLVAAEQQQLAEALLQALDSIGVIPASGAAGAPEGSVPSPTGRPGPVGQPPVAAEAPMPEQPIVPGVGGEGPTG